LGHGICWPRVGSRPQKAAGAHGLGRLVGSELLRGKLHLQVRLRLGRREQRRRRRRDLAVLLRSGVRAREHV
tara:strand:+ start:186 stop:401 length:216 start_codon:yes stop_codon:yes gene_type:complete